MQNLLIRKIGSIFRFEIVKIKHSPDYKVFL